MDSPTVPSNLANVIAPLREADEYTRLQTIRQRGLYNLVTGFPMFIFLLPAWIQLEKVIGSNTWGAITVTAIVWTLFVVSCFPRVFLPLVRRWRPDWQSPLLEASLLKRALEKHFWLQFPFWMAMSTFLTVGIFLFPHLRLLWFIGVPLILTFAMVALAWQARRAGDLAMAWTFLAWIPTGIVLLASLATLFRVFEVLDVLAAALTTPPILVGLVRLLAPRRWLVR